MADLVFYEVGVGLAGLAASVFFLIVLDQNPNLKWRRIAFKFTAALTFFSVKVLTQILDKTWQVMSFYGINFPPLNVFFEAVVMAFMVSGLWELWTRHLKE